MINTKTYNVELTYDEIILLDNKCSNSVQKIVNLAKNEKSFGLDSLSNEILAKSLETGKLTWTSVRIRGCKYCDNKPSGFNTYTRNSRYHYKGQLNYDSPFSYSGILPNDNGFIVQGSMGICRDCWYKIYLPKIVKYIIDNDLPIEIQKNDIAIGKYKKDKKYICYNCNKEIYESEMGKEPTLMRNGYYPSECPHCGAKQLFLGKSHKITDDFRMIKV